jgi:hypothetical protein
VRIEVNGAGYARQEKVAEVTLNLEQKLQEGGLSGAVDQTHLRLVEIDANEEVLDDQVPFQFDQDPGYLAVGQLVFLLQGTTGPYQTRMFDLYLDTVDNDNGKPPALVTSLVQLEDGITWEGQASYHIRTRTATYYYHKQGAGFASLFSPEGFDWISYHPTGGPAGNYRGVPNVATYVGGEPVALFHPGETGGTSQVLHAGPLRLTIESATGDATWVKRWAIYPDYATMILVQKPDDLRYWFLYEGTPGGTIDAGDYYVLPGGERRAIDMVLNTDLPGEEWAYFGDDAQEQVLYVINHQEDEAQDCHRVMDSSMTVFGFGRGSNSVSDKLLEAVPASFSIGFADAGAYDDVQAVIHSAYKPLGVSVGPGVGR